MHKELKDYYKSRKGSYVKKTDDEDFLKSLNEFLFEKEKIEYKDYPIKHPFMFVFGLPRSGTTLLTQVIAHGLDVGFINNFAARFFLAPIYGIKLSKIILGSKPISSFSSDYAKTNELTDIHEFGYFWRHWLKKEDISGVTNANEVENQINWQGLKKCLASIQQEFNKPMIFKNIFGSYHPERLSRVLEKVLFIYIVRDNLDSAISILRARKRYYTDLNTWWSYMPIEYNQIAGMKYMEQIAGQVYFLRKYYDSLASSMDNVLTITYSDLVSNPACILDSINEKLKLLYNIQISTRTELPKFYFREHTKNSEEKMKFKTLIEKFEKKYGVL